MRLNHLLELGKSIERQLAASRMNIISRCKGQYARVLAEQRTINVAVFGPDGKLLLAGDSAME
jgi:hypothetical protein